MSRAIEATGGTRDFDAVIGPHIEAGYRYAVTLLQDPEEARDAVQEAQIKAWRSIARLRDLEQAKAWFFSIVHNQCRSTMRKRWWLLGRNPLRAVRVDWQEDRMARSMDIDAGMRRLHPHDRAILELFYYGDLTLEEVAQTLELSVGAARSRLYRAAKKLKPNLTEEDLR